MEDDNITAQNNHTKMTDDGNASTTNDEKIVKLEAAYRQALAAFKQDKTNKDLRRAKSAAKQAWDEAVVASNSGAERLTCRDCSQMFLFTTEDQDFYRKNGWEHKPQRCKPCKEASQLRLGNRTNRDGKTKNMCYAFQKGECGYGDQCKFSHDPKGKTRKDDEDEKETKRDKKEVTFIAVCKFGSLCKLKKCRFRHDKEAMQVCEEIIETSTEGSLSSKKTEKTKDKDKTVIKAMKHVLKKAPGRQLKMKELRKLIRAKITTENTDKDKLKLAISDAIAAHKDSLVVEGKMVQLS